MRNTDDLIDTGYRQDTCIETDRHGRQSRSDYREVYVYTSTTSAEGRNIMYSTSTGGRSIMRDAPQLNSNTLHRNEFHGF